MFEIDSTLVKAAKVRLDIDEFADFTDTTAIYPGTGTGNDEELAYLALGLNGESGEIAEKVKKLIRDRTWETNAVEKELGDVAWYWVRMCRAIGKNPSEVLTTVVNKLSDRKKRGVIQGSGDAR